MSPNTPLLSTAIEENAWVCGRNPSFCNAQTVLQVLGWASALESLLDPKSSTLGKLTVVRAGSLFRGTSAL